jgi:hypothetical protein
LRDERNSALYFRDGRRPGAHGSLARSATNASRSNGSTQ